VARDGDDSELVPAAEIGRDLELSWNALLASDPTLGSPYLTPEFTTAVAQVRPDVEVAVFLRGGAAAGFFPFQRGRRGRGRPVGFGISDHHGIVAPGDLEVPPPVLLRACGLRCLEFDHLAAGRPGYDRWSVPTSSPVIDLRAGHETWLSQRRAAHGSGFGQLARKSRKLRRRADVRYERHVDDVDVLRTVMAWKSAQYARTGVTDAFAREWVRDLLELLHKTRTPAFSGQLSALWVDGELAAAHMGIVTGRIWHYWFPVYNERFAPFSPGLLLLLEMAADAAAEGVDQIDLGRGDARYKREFANRSVPLLTGHVGDGARFLTARHADRIVRRAEIALKASPLAGPLRRPATALRSRRGRRRLT
jgi:CelD/BcsL family acetyltransferase involved in cellulose biosynthesis